MRRWKRLNATLVTRGRLTRTAVVVVLGVVFIQVGLARGRACRAVEYAELKDMPTEELVETYCRYGKLMDIYFRSDDSLSETNADLLDLYRRVSEAGLVGQIREIEKSLDKVRVDREKALATAGECIDERAKIKTAMKSRSLPEDPKCDATGKQIR